MTEETCGHGTYLSTCTKPHGAIRGSITGCQRVLPSNTALCGVTAVMVSATGLALCAEHSPARSFTGEMVTLEFVVRATVDPERYAHEYGDELESVREYIRLNLGQTLEVLLATPNSRLYDTHSHWMRTEISPVHRITATEHGDALLPGQLPFYNNRTGMFEAPCTCGRRFTGNDPDEADSNLYSHVFPEADECEHGDVEEGDKRNEFHCGRCGIPMTWVGPMGSDYAPVDR